LKVGEALDVLACAKGTGEAQQKPAAWNHDAELVFHALGKLLAEGAIEERIHLIGRPPGKQRQIEQIQVRRKGRNRRVGGYRHLDVAAGDSLGLVACRVKLTRL